MGQVLGAWIRQQRHAKRWAQKDLERESGVSQRTISRLETGATLPSAPELRRIAGAFRLPVGEAFAALVSDLAREYLAADDAGDGGAG